MSAELKDRQVRPRRTLMSYSLAMALLLSPLASSPTNAIDVSAPESDWQESVRAEATSYQELASEIADGALRLIVVTEENNQPETSVLNLKSKAALDYTLRATSSDPYFIAVLVDEKISLIDEPTIGAAAIPAPTTSYTQWNYTAMRLAEIHTSFTGTNVKVAVIDSGVDRENPELNGGQVLDGCDWVTSPTNVCRGTGVLDENGHGTHVAGIIAAKNDGVGITGVAPGATILPLRVLGANGSGWLSDIAAAIDYAVADGAKVINLSLGGSLDYSLIRISVEQAVASGVTVVAAAGNDGPGAAASYPAAYPGAIAVAATTESNLIASYSNSGNYIDVAAPGSAILSSWPTGTGYARLSGTSMASPHVAALAALIIQRNTAASGSTSPATIRTAIESVAVKSNSDYSVSRYGLGVINPFASLECATPVCATPSSTPQPVDVLVTGTPEVITPGAIIAPTPQPTPEPAPIIETAPVVVVPTIKETLNVKVAKKRKLTVVVTAPTGSKTWVQRKVGKKWKTVLKITTTPSVQVKLSRSGTYRVQVIAPSEKVTSKSYKVK
jgi:serine protease